MERFEYTIRMEAGMHARPVAALVSRLKPLEEQVTLACGTRCADAKKIFAVMGMEIQRGETVTVTMVGPNEVELAAELREFFQEYF